MRKGFEVLEKLEIKGKVGWVVKNAYSARRGGVRHFRTEKKNGEGQGFKKREKRGSLSKLAEPCGWGV